jgi:hypothetical protein
MTDGRDRALTMVEAAVHFRTIAALITLPLALLACGESMVDLDASLSEANVLAVVHDRIEKMAVDEQRVYWFGSHLQPTDGYVWFLRSCQKRNCAATIVTYDAPLYRARDVFSVSGGEVYWYRSNPNETPGELVACPITGCSGSPRTVASEISFYAATFDADRFYFFSQTSLYSLSLSQAGPAQEIAWLPFQLQAIVIHDAYAYGLAAKWSSIDGPARNTSSLVRTRTDGLSSVETVAKDVLLSDSHAFGVSADTTSIYWTNNLLSGSVNRCPLVGCSDVPDVVIRPLRAPQKLQIDGSELYYVYEPRPYQYALSSCTLPACAQSVPLIEHLDAPGALAMDAEYLYVATTEQDVSPSNLTEDTVARIRRLPKPHREVP